MFTGRIKHQKPTQIYAKNLRRRWYLPHQTSRNIFPGKVIGQFGVTHSRTTLFSKFWPPSCSRFQFPASLTPHNSGLSSWRSDSLLASAVCRFCARSFMQSEIATSYQERRFRHLFSFSDTVTCPRPRNWCTVHKMCGEDRI